MKVVLCGTCDVILCGLSWLCEIVVLFPSCVTKYFRGHGTCWCGIQLSHVAVFVYNYLCIVGILLHTISYMLFIQVTVLGASWVYCMCEQSYVWLVSIHYRLILTCVMFFLMSIKVYTVGWVIWPVKTVPEMTYNVPSGTLSFYSLTQ